MKLCLKLIHPVKDLDKHLLCSVCIKGKAVDPHLFTDSLDVMLTAQRLSPLLVIDHRLETLKQFDRHGYVIDAVVLHFLCKTALEVLEVTLV